MKKLNLYQLMLGIFVFYTLNCCKDKDNTATPIAPTGSLEFHIHTNVGNSEVEEYGVEYYANNRKMIIVKSQMYISGIELVKLDGNIVNAPNQSFLIENANDEYKIVNLPVGNYRSIRFYVGLDEITNQKKAGISDTLINRADMWFGNSAEPNKYVFLNFQGSIDTTDAKNGSTLVNFDFKIGTISNRKQVFMPDLNFTIAANQIAVLHMAADYNRLFDGINLTNNGNLILNTTSDNSSDLAAKLVSNISLVLDYEK
ncbi:MAG: MbnP family protein [Cytophagales bacterium]